MYFCKVKIVKPLLISLLIVFTFFGNVGMSVFTHSCKEDGVFRSYFVKTQEHCESNEKEIVHPCCKVNNAEKDELRLKEKNCCNDQVNVFKINLDYFSEYQLAIPQYSICEIPFNFNFALNYRKETIYQSGLVIHPPPRLSGRELLIKHQVFRI
jgi:hypothetical protein